MADTYIDQYEILGYGRFSAGQIKKLVLGLDLELDPMVNIIALRLKNETDAMQAALEKAGQLEAVTYKGDAGQPNAIAGARDVMRRLIHYVEAYPKGKEMAADLLQGVSLTTTLKRRPAKLAAAMSYALSQMVQYESALPEYQSRRTELLGAFEALEKLNADVRKSRTERQEMTPEVAAQRSKWLATYSAAKLIIEGILKPLNKVHWMPEIFDDLAEEHQVAGAQDAAPEGSPA